MTAEAAAAARAALLGGADQRALIEDLMALLAALGEDTGKGPGFDLPAEVTDYRIDGDRATAKAGDETLEFARVDGRWYAAPQRQGPEAAPPATP